MGDGATSTIHAMIGEARRSQTALAQLLDLYRAYLCLLAEREIEPRLATRCAASDIVQETIVEAFGDFAKFSGDQESELTAWLERILKNNIMDAVRKHLVAKRRSAKREEPLYGGTDSASFEWREMPGPRTTASCVMIKGERALRLAEVIMGLPEGQGEAVRLRYLEGLTVAEMAERMDRSKLSVASLLKRGLKTLRANMSPDSWLQE
jgi:RNA polymerase sigma-70 factor (ECF subfamily)